MIRQVGSPLYRDAADASQIPGREKFAEFWVVDAEDCLRNEVLGQRGLERFVFPVYGRASRQIRCSLIKLNLSHDEKACTQVDGVVGVVGAGDDTWLAQYFPVYLVSGSLGQYPSSNGDKV